MTLTLTITRCITASRYLLAPWSTDHAHTLNKQQHHTSALHMDVLNKSH